MNDENNVLKQNNEKLTVNIRILLFIKVIYTINQSKFDTKYYFSKNSFIFFYKNYITSLKYTSNDFNSKII